MVPLSQPASRPCRPSPCHSASLQPAPLRWRAFPVQPHSHAMHLVVVQKHLVGAPLQTPCSSSSTTNGVSGRDCICQGHRWCKRWKGGALSADKRCGISDVLHDHAWNDGLYRRTGAVRPCASSEVSGNRGQAAEAVPRGGTCVPVKERYADEEDFIKAGGNELDLVQLQASKSMDQPSITDKVVLAKLSSACWLQ